MAKEISQRASAIKSSVTLEIEAKAKALKAEGVDVVSFGAGEPDFNTPSHVVKAAIAAMEAGKTRYTPASGTMELKEAVCRKLQRDNGLSYRPNQIVISNGAKHSLFNALQVLCSPGDSVIISAPYWVSYVELIKMAGAVPVIVNAREETGFLANPQDIRAAVTPKTKAIIINSPNNPTGAVYSRTELEEIARIAVENDLYVISDEIYESLIYDGAEHVSIASLGEDIKNLTITVNGLSKAYAMTGWRIGYTASSPEIARVMGNYQSHATSNANSIAQAAGVAALDGSKEELHSMIAEFNRRRLYMVQRINDINGLSCVTPKGAFYVFVNISGVFGKHCDDRKIDSALTFADCLLQKQLTAVVPGEAFGDSRYIRLAYATDMQSIIKGCDRIAKFVAALR